MKKMDKSYTGKKVLVTGHTGFKGSWLVHLLDFLGAEVAGYALQPTEEVNLFEISEAQLKCHSIIGDIRDTSKFYKSITEFQPDIIFHLAAQPLVLTSYEDPLDTYSTNIIGTANLLDCVRELEYDCSVVVITTDKVYHNQEWAYPYRESERLGGIDPYSCSKACVELICTSYQEAFYSKTSRYRKVLSTARAGNVIGGGDWAKNRIVPDVIRAFLSYEQITLRNPHAVRPWQHVLDPLYGYLVLGEVLLSGGGVGDAWNFGPAANSNLTVLDLVKEAQRTWGDHHSEIKYVDSNFHEAQLLKLDISKTKSQLGWKPKWSEKEAIAKTIEWYKGYHLNGKSAETLVMQQVNQYFEP